MSTIDAERVREHVAETSGDLIDLASELVAQPSVTGEEAPAQAVVVETLEGLGLEPDVWEPDPAALRDHPGYFETSSFEAYGYEGRPNVAVRIPGSGDGRSLAFSGHVDVVSPEPVSAWSHDPWDPTVEDGRLYGRGAADMKGGVAAFLHAYRSLAACGVDLAGDLVLQTTIEEEDGGVGGVLSALERGYQTDAAVVPEPWGIPNVGIASAGVMYFRVTVPGRTAHAARGYKGVDAMEKATAIFLSLQELDRERKARISYEPATRRDPAAEGNVTNLNVGVVRAGDWPSTVPGEVLMECRIGWPPGETRTEVREQVEGAIQAVVDEDEWLADHPPQVEWYGWSAEPHELDPDAEIVQLAKRHAEQITGRTGQYIGGSAGLDERFFNLYYDVPAVTMGPDGENIHSADEYVDINSLVETSQALATIAMEWCGTA